MSKLKMHSPDLTATNIDKLAELFPNCVTESRDEKGELRKSVDFDLLRQELSGAVVEGLVERYTLNWPGKREAIVAANSPVYKTLRPCEAESVDFATTKNLYIEGDNLEVLKLLQETYLGKVKMIYIDPPYNTGNDFIYDDDFAADIETDLLKSSQKDDIGGRLVANPESNGRFHSDWLTMLYPRLKLARDLLSDDGVVFISIDDHEVHNLRKLCDELFGADNFVNQFAWVNNITGRQISGKGAAKTYEYVLSYAKNILAVSEFTIGIKFAKQCMPDTYKGFKKDIRTDERGEFAIGDTLYNHNRIFNEETRRNLVFSIFYNPETSEIITGDINEKKQGFVELLPHKNGDGVHKYHAWRWSRQKIYDENYDLIVLPTTYGYEIHTKIRAFSVTLLKDIITNISNGDAEVKALFDGRKYFDYPKPVNLLKALLGAQVSSDAVILDFFSGSATTAHAVMQLNAEDGGNRRFIMVQLPEVCDEQSEAFKAGYKTICEIGKERIRRAGRKIKDENATNAPHLDVGFRVFKVDSSNMKDVYYTPDAMEQSKLDLFADAIKDDRNPEDLLFQVFLECGLDLALLVVKEQVEGRAVYTVDQNVLIACFDNDIPESLIRTLAQRKPLKAVFLDRSFAKDSTKLNVTQIFKQLAPDTEVKTI
jgi:adenine-specific DNA-methyltransferase